MKDIKDIYSFYIKKRNEFKKGIYETIKYLEELFMAKNVFYISLPELIFEYDNDDANAYYIVYSNEGNSENKSLFIIYQRDREDIFDYIDLELLPDYLLEDILSSIKDKDLKKKQDKEKIQELENIINSTDSIP
jgi:hypothetical protein